MGREGGREAWRAALAGVGESVILDVLQHLSPSLLSLCECCGLCFFSFLHLLSSIRFPIGQIPIDMTCAVEVQQEFVVYLFYSSPLEVSLTSLLPLSSQSSVQDWGEEVEEGAIYNVDTEEGSDSAGGQQGSKMAGGE